jgi:hypothetical protein
MSRRTRLRAVLAILAVLGGTVGPGALTAPIASAQTAPLGFDFESPSQASGTTWTAGACHAPTWLGSNDGGAAQSSAFHTEGAASLALPIRMTGGSFDQAGANCVLPDPRPWDLTPYSAVTFDVYAPAAGLKADFIFNDPWHPSSTPLRDLAAGWNTLTYDITSTGADFPGGQQEGKELVLRIVGQNVTLTGVVYFDNVRFVSSTNPTVSVLAPRADDTIATDPGATDAIRATATAGTDRSIASVTWRAGDQSGPMALDPASGEWRGAWDSWAGGDGVRTVQVTATDSEGGATTIPVTVLVQNSRLAVRTLSPSFDSRLHGRVTVVAKVRADPRFALRSVGLRVGHLRLPAWVGRPGADGWRTATASLDTRRVRDGVQTLRVVAKDSRFAVSGEIDVRVANHKMAWEIVRAHGTGFRAGHERFAFSGWNEYELFTRVDRTTEHVQETLSGRVIPKGTVIGWPEQIDRQMLEAARHHLDVLRTWAFDDNPDSFAFQPQLGVYNEDAFKKLDYIVDSARRHGIRVILTFTNYWGDYGGIGRYTAQLGLENKN